MHSKAKLALAVLTSPGAAFEEILERQLLGAALVIAAAAGALSCVGATLSAVYAGPVAFLMLGKYNPLTWFGLYLLYTLAMQRLLRWLGTDLSYTKVLTIVGWSQVALLLAAVVSTVAGAIALSGGPVGQPYELPLTAVLYIAYVVAIAAGVRSATRAPTARGAMSYVVVAIAIGLACSYTYGQSRMKLFIGALPGVASAAQRVASMDMIPWAAAGAIGLGLGLWHMAKELGWDTSTRNRRLLAGVLAGAAVLGSYTYVLTRADYYGQLFSIQRDYGLGKYDEAVSQLKQIASATRSNVPSPTSLAHAYQTRQAIYNSIQTSGTDPLLLLDIADISYLAGHNDEARRYYDDYAAAIRKASVSREGDIWLARAFSGIGTIYDQQGRYDLAVKHFEAAKKAWPVLRDPWVRLAVTYDRMGNYKQAIQSGEHATNKLGSRAAVVYIALAQAYTQTGESAKAKAAIAKVREIDDELADRMGMKPEDWKRAISKLAAKDLLFPLERDPVFIPKRPSKAKPQKK